MNDFLENDGSKRIIFFLFYLIFFIMVILLLRSSFKSNNTSQLTKDNTGYKHEFNLEKIKNNNYHFTYTLEKNGEKVIFDGDRFNNMSTFSVSGIESTNYYEIDNNYYIKDKNNFTWNKTNNPFEFSMFLDSEVIEKLLIHSTYISRTYYFDKENFDYTYEITSSSILSSIDLKNADDDSMVNIITVHVNKNIVESIDINLTSYFNMKDKNINSYKLKLAFSKFGDIEENDVKVIK